MKRYYHAISTQESRSASLPETHASNTEQQNMPANTPRGDFIDLQGKRNRVECNLEEIEPDPGLRPNIYDYTVSVRDEIRRSYLQNGPCQPDKHKFPQKMIGTKLRRFNKAWFCEFPTWLEYSISQDAAYCLCCYLFIPEGEGQGGRDAFISKGFTNWKKKDSLQIHVGGPNSSHNQALKKCEDLMKQKQSIQYVLERQSKAAESAYDIRLNASINCVRFLLRQGLAFRGHDESNESKNKGNFLELLQFLAEHNDEVKGVVLDNAPENLKLIAHDIQTDIVNAFVLETTKMILQEIEDENYSILVDEARDISNKEQMAIVLRFVNGKGHVVERFLGLIHVTETTSLSLKKAIDGFFSMHNLSISQLRGQGYDGASNMRGEMNGLKSLILKENNSAYYVHCFAHQLQLSLVVVAKNHPQVASLFLTVNYVINSVGSSCKRHDQLRELQISTVKNAFAEGEIVSGRGLNQETTLRRAGDTRWSSHYKTLISIIVMFSAVVDVLEIISEDGSSSEQRAEALSLMDSIQTFDFIFTIHLVRDILGITNELSQALQRRDQDIVNAMNLVDVSKRRLQKMCDSGWDSLFAQVSIFCNKNHILIPNMEDMWVVKGRPRRKIDGLTFLHHFQVDLFYSVIDMQLQELNNRFTEANTNLLLCVACLNPSDNFKAFHKEKMMEIARFYPRDFSSMQMAYLENQLETFIMDMQSDERFSKIKGICELAEKMILHGKHIVYVDVYKLIKLALILPVATATVERSFSIMNIIKSRRRNRMHDKWLNDSMIVYIEKEIFDTIHNSVIA